MAGGCSPQTYGVDDDMVGVVMNYVCCAILMGTAGHLFFSNGWERGKVGVKTELGMSAGYLLGGLVHHLFANRANKDHCASGWFYILFPISYLTMIFSGWSWLGIVTRYTKTAIVVKFIWSLSGLLIVSGGIWCQSTVTLFWGTWLGRIEPPDQCHSSDGEPWCDTVMFYGEGIFYIIWIVTWFVVSLDLHPQCRQCTDRVLNYGSVVSLLWGPGQILLTGVVPMLDGAENASDQTMDIYCTLRTGTTYIVAVLLSHIFTFVWSSVLFHREEAGEGCLEDYTSIGTKAQGREPLMV